MSLLVPPVWRLARYGGRSAPDTIPIKFSASSIRGPRMPRVSLSPTFFIAKTQQQRFKLIKCLLLIGPDRLEDDTGALKRACNRVKCRFSAHWRSGFTQLDLFFCNNRSY